MANTTKKWWNYKKYQTSMSYCGVHFATNGSEVAAVCPCGWMVLAFQDQIDDAMIATVAEHYEREHSNG